MRYDDDKALFDVDTTLTTKPSALYEHVSVSGLMPCLVGSADKHATQMAYQKLIKIFDEVSIIYEE